MIVLLILLLPLLLLVQVPVDNLEIIEEFGVVITCESVPDDGVDSSTGDYGEDDSSYILVEVKKSKLEKISLPTNTKKPRQIL